MSFTANKILRSQKRKFLKWVSATLPSVAQWSSVTYGEGRFVAIAKNTDSAAYSEDGSTWVPATLPSIAPWSSVTYGEGRFVAIAGAASPLTSASAAYSEDGSTWVSATLPASRNWSSVAYGAGRFVAVAIGGGFFAYSEDGTTWVEGSIASGNYYGVAYGVNKFVAVAPFSQQAYSANGITWQYTTSPSGLWNRLSFAKDKFFASQPSSVSSNGMYSLDGLTWVSITSVTDGPIVYGSEPLPQGRFFTGALYGTDGLTWTNQGLVNPSIPTSMTYGEGRFVGIFTAGGASNSAGYLTSIQI